MTTLELHLHPNCIPEHAFQVVQSLQEHGFTTYLVGGCVRDLLLKKDPKDFDIATSAEPKEVRRFISRAYVIGKRFQLVLVKRGEHQLEVATFRRNQTPEDLSEDEEAPLGDNIFGSPEEDAQRRDFTINGLFYDPVEDELIDFSNGLVDLEAGIVRMIGEPTERILEDPIRILRGIRLAHMIQFSIEPSLRLSMQANAESLASSALPRRREEYLKFLKLPDPSLPFMEAFDLNVLKYVAPYLNRLMEDPLAADVFLQYLKNFHRVKWESPLELFAGLTLAYVRSVIEPDPLQPLETNNLLENEELNSMMRDELGIFKYEQLIILRALHFQTLLSELESSKKPTAESQKMSLLKSEAFPIALKFAMKDYSLPSEALFKWQMEYEKVLPEIEEYKKQKLRKKSQRTRQRYSKRASFKRTAKPGTGTRTGTKTD